MTNDHYWAFPFWVSVPVALLLMGALGYVLEVTLLRRMSGQSQIAVVVLTVALGFIIRFLAGAIWGHEPQGLEIPIAGFVRAFPAGRTGTVRS